ncbi:hypothetical protein HKX48_005832 [Thoreauomyces humboldtii]|nr:hypothetical protein HKX48_005832 [Thoreauomyces humboldtii]
MAVDDPEQARESTRPAKSEGWKIPLPLLLFLTTTLVAAAITIPIAVLSDNGATATVNDIVSLLRENYGKVRQVSDKITTELSTVYEIIQVNAANQAVRAVTDQMVTGVPVDFYSKDALLFAYEESIIRSNFIFSAGFFRADNLDKILVSTPYGPGVYCMANSTDPTGKTCQALAITAVTPAGAVAKSLAPFVGYSPPSTATGPNAVWDQTPIFIYEGGTTWLGIFGLAWCQWQGLALGEAAAGDPVGRHLIITKFERISILLAGIQTTPNTAIAVWLRNAGSLIATNQAASVLDPSSVAQNPNAGQSFLPTTYPNAFISSASRFLFAAHGGTPQVLPNSTSNTFDGSGGKLFVESRRFDGGAGLDLTIMVVIPESDLLGAIKAARKKVIGTSIGIAFAMLGLATATSFLVTLPLRRLTKVMQQATNMDFSALTGGFLAGRPQISELAIMQRTFETMLRRFASAIESNKKLQMGRMGVTSSLTSATPNSTTPLKG